MIKKTKLINADKDAWCRIRVKFPGVSDSKRTRIIDILLEETISFDLMGKLKPEISDTKQDKLMKKLVKEMFGGRH